MCQSLNALVLPAWLAAKSATGPMRVIRRGAARRPDAGGAFTKINQLNHKVRGTLRRTNRGRCGMPSHAEQATLAYTADDLFDVVADVADYPRFVPWCTGATVRSAGEHEIIADLVIGFGPFNERFTSQVALDRPRQVLVQASDGPLEHLTNRWTFTPEGPRTHVDFRIDFQFKSHLLDHVAATMFHEAATRMMSAFEARVHLLRAMHRHGTKTS